MRCRIWDSIRINSVRIGKYMELQVSADTKEDAEVQVRSACDKLLANPVMEDYTLRIEPAV